MFSVVVGGFFYWTSLLCTNQASVQKCMSLRSIKKANLALIFSIVGKSLRRTIERLELKRGCLQVLFSFLPSIFILVLLYSNIMLTVTQSVLVKLLPKMSYCRFISWMCSTKLNLLMAFLSPAFLRQVWGKNQFQI